jgi:hypothetical protein
LSSNIIRNYNDETYLAPEMQQQNQSVVGRAETRLNNEPELQGGVMDLLICWILRSAKLAFKQTYGLLLIHLTSAKVKIVTAQLF